VRALFDYLAPPSDIEPAPGTRLRVPFGRSMRVGVLVDIASHSTVEARRLRRVEDVLDEAPAIPEDLLDLLRWAADYYQHPIGDVIVGALPAAMRRTTKNRGTRHAPPVIAQTDAPMSSPPALNAAQRRAVEAIMGSRDRFATFLLDGITGSGKTEVYFRIIEELTREDRQVLVLVPEIGLTPQIVDRIRRRFHCPIAIQHSDLSDRERSDAWRLAASGAASILVGTRSAIFTPLPGLGAIIVDEEHDPSYKQQTGFRYSARDLAIVRAKRRGVPVVLGSATPSLESTYNADTGRYQRLVLPDRAGAAAKPALRLIDLRREPLDRGLSATLAVAMERHLAQGNQVLLFLNRRGFAPTVLCDSCGWIASCRRCDAHMVFHRARSGLRCHHCDARSPMPDGCPNCGRPELRPVGIGTERLEEALALRFPETEIVRIDRDSARPKGALESLLARVRDGGRQILLGTQMLAKGHHLPNVTLVGVIDADSGLFGSDFRAGERMGQLIIQVAGRAGRAEKAGEVMIQTRFPDHPLLAALLGHDYSHFAHALLAERKLAGMPPYRGMIIVRAEAIAESKPIEFLTSVRARADAIVPPDVEILGPAPSPIERRAGRYRAQLLMLAARRAALNTALSRLVREIEALPKSTQVRWSVDVDPIDDI
jgi:primosomal protein N' (replication factor Y)